MPDGELDPDNPNVVEYGPDPDGVTVDVTNQDVIDVELFGAAGESTIDSDGAAGGRVIAREYDVSDDSEITLVVADGREGELDGGPSELAGNGGGLTAVVRDGTIDIAAHGGGGGFSEVQDGGGGGGGAAGGSGGFGGSSDGGSGETDGDVVNLGGDGGVASPEGDFLTSDPDPGSGEVTDDSLVDSADTFEGGGRSIHGGLARIKFAPVTTIEITDTNSPVPVGETVEVEVDVTNEGDEMEQITVKLEVDPA